MTTTDPDQIRREIEATRTELSTDVDALNYKVSPGRIVDDRKRRAQGAIRRVRDRVMGTASDLGEATGSATSALSDRTSSAASTVAEAAGQAPGKLRERSEGNPLAAGLIAFGVGWLASSLIPATSREQQAASQLKQLADGPTTAIKDAVSGAAQEVADELREPARDAAQALRSTATNAAQQVKEDGRSAAHEIRDHARDQAKS
jgi:hypothetical protein